MSYDPISGRNFLGLRRSPSTDAPLTKADLDAYFRANPINSTIPVQGLNPLQFINPAYTRTSAADSSLSPLAQFQAFKQTGALPQNQNTFTPWNQPATPMVEAFTPPAQSKPGFLGTSGAK
jgi:hypothetical protein